VIPDWMHGLLSENKQAGSYLAEDSDRQNLQGVGISILQRPFCLKPEKGGPKLALRLLQSSVSEASICIS